MQIDLTVIARHDHAFGAVGVLFFYRHTGSDQRRAGLEEWRIERHAQTAID
ncbi:hypothetical protein D3C76_1820700 [compost metagenome]